MKSKELKEGTYMEFLCKKHYHNGLYEVAYHIPLISHNSYIVMTKVSNAKFKFFFLLLSNVVGDFAECSHGLKPRAITDQSEIDLIKLST